MSAAIRALLHGILDYAGLFPPAQLPLEDALANFRRYLTTSPHQWIMQKFVCPVGRLRDVVAWIRKTRSFPALTLSVLGDQAANPGEFLQRFEDTLNEATWFWKTWNDDGIIQDIEIALPKPVDIAALVKPLGAIAKALQDTVITLWLETPGSPTWQEDVANLAKELQSIHDRRRCQLFGMKLRCGGAAAQAFPPSEQVAFFIDRCRDAKLRWKATAGLHHPRPHWDAKLEVWQHGFLNVFLAGLLAQAHSLDQASMVEILADQKGKHFHFEPDELGWKDWSCTIAQIKEFRKNTLTTFGSCSFEEPVDDLLAMGFLNP